MAGYSSRQGKKRKSKASKPAVPVAPQNAITSYFRPVSTAPTPTLPDSTVTSARVPLDTSDVTAPSKIELDQKDNRKLRSSTRIALQDVTNRSLFDRQSLTGETGTTSDTKPISRKRTFGDINGTEEFAPSDEADDSEEFAPCDEENIIIDESVGTVIKAIKRGTKNIGHLVTRPVDSEILDNAFMWINDDGEEIVQRHRGESDYQGLMARTLPDFVIEKRIKAPKRFAALDEHDEDPFAFVHSHEKLVVHPERLEFKAQVLAAHTQRGNRTLWDLGVTIKGVRRTLFRIQRELFSRHEITLILSEMMDAVVRWPTLNELFGNPNRNTTLATILFSTAQQSVLPEKPMLCGGYTIGKQVFLSILIRLPFIDRDTLKAATTEVTITPKAIKEECDEVESTLFTFDQGITWDGPNENGEFPSILKRGVSEADDASREGFDRAQRLARLCRGTWARKSPLSTKAQLNAGYRGFIDQYHKELRVYDGSCLILTNAQILLTQLNPSAKIYEHISGQSLPSVQIYSMDRSWVDLVMDKAISTWMQTSDLIKTYEILGIMADEINKRILSGEPSPASCHCIGDKQKSSNTTHPCGGCGKRVLCCMLQLSFRGLRSCPRCVLKGHPDFTNNAERNCFFKLKFLIQADLKLVGAKRDSPGTLHLINEAKQWLHHTFINEKGMAYVNMYSGKRLEPPPQAFHLLTPLVDATFPFVLTNSGMNTHYSDNIAVIPTCINYTKGTCLPIALAKVAKYLRKIESMVDESDPWFNDKVDMCLFLLLFGQESPEYVR